MKELQLIDRVVVEIRGEEGEKCSPFDIAQELRKIADRIDDCIKGDNELRTNPNNGHHTELLWERECTAYGFRMGDKSLIGMHYYGSEKKDEFPVITLMREDLEQKGFDTSNLGDEWMEKIASKVGDILLDSDYWDHLVWAAEYYKVPRKEEE
jgi:hypothetical protein